MIGKTRVFGMVAVALALAACDAGKAPQETNATTASENQTAATPLPLPSPSSPPIAEPLARYVAKYPDDKVDGMSWKSDPLVVKAIDEAVTDPKVRQWLHDGNGPASPIGRIGDRIASWGCEAHNCGDHQWVTLIDPGTGKAEICYADNAALPGKTRWFAQGKEETRAGACPSSES